MSERKQSRREFVKRSAAALAGAGIVRGARAGATKRPMEITSPNERLRLGAIGMRYQGTVIAKEALPWADVVAICDVDRLIAENARADFGGKADLYEDYRKMLERDDLDAVTIGTPDHWHTAMAIDACRAGKDVYCEKPLTLTVDEGKLLCKVVRETGRVFQVGTWQRSDHRFRLACETVRAGRLGRLKRAVVTIDKNPTGGPFDNAPAPPNLNWDLWLGQAPKVPYCQERCHYTFRWWYEYSGGKMTDWGAHHIDIAQWGLGVDDSGPVEIDGKAKFPNVGNGYNVPPWFEAQMKYENGVEVLVMCEGKIGVLFEGEKGRIFVTRGGITSDPVELVESDAMPREDYRLYAHDNLKRTAKVGKLDATHNHMGNFFDCIKTRHTPLSDVFSQHRSVSACHLATISMRLGRALKWDPRKEAFVGDEEADRWLRREQRKPYQLKT